MKGKANSHLSTLNSQFPKGPLWQSVYLTQDSYDSIHPDIQELIKLLVSIVKTSKGASNGQ